MHAGGQRKNTGGYDNNVCARAMAFMHVRIGSKYIPFENTPPSWRVKLFNRVFTHIYVLISPVQYA